MILRCSWRGFSPALLGTALATHSSRSCSCQLSNNTLEQVVFLPAIQQHPQEGGCAPSRMHVRAIRPMPTVTGIFVISDKTHRSSSAHLHTDNISYQKFSVKMHQTPNTQPYRNSPRNSQPLLFKYTESKFFYREKITCSTHHFHGLRASKSS